MNKNYYAILMAGGVGSRFWPVSTEEFPKQFHAAAGRESGTGGGEEGSQAAHLPSEPAAVRQGETEHVAAARVVRQFHLLQVHSDEKQEEIAPGFHMLRQLHRIIRSSVDDEFAR